METIEINIIGLEEAGKSTLTNALTGTNYSKKCTTVESIFYIGNFDSSVYTSSDLIETSLGDKEVYIPYPSNFGLSREWNYSISDYVGITSKKIRRDPSVKLLDEREYVYDLYVVVCDVNKFDEDFNKIKDLLNIINTKKHDPSNIVVILNKCDSIVYSKTLTSYYDSDEKIMVGNATTKLNEAGFFNVIPFCAKKCMLFSAGENNMFNEKDDEDKYIAETDNITPSVLLNKSGFAQLTSFIDDFIKKHRNQLINKHALNELFSGENHKIEKITTIISRMKGADDDIATKVKGEVLKCIDNFESENFDEAHDNKIGYFEQAVQNLTTAYNSVFTSGYPEVEEMCKKLLKHVEIKYYKMLLEKSYDDNAVQKLYDNHLLSHMELEKIIIAHVANDNILHVIRHISTLTMHNIDYLFCVINAFVKHVNKSIVCILKVHDVKDEVFNHIKLKILYGSGENSYKYDFSHEEYVDNKALLTKIDGYFMDLGNKGSYQMFDDCGHDISNKYDSSYESR